MELENHHLATVTVKINSSKNNEWVLRVKEVKSKEEEDIYTVSKHVPKETLINYKGKLVTFSGEVCHPDGVIKVNTSSS